MRGGCPATRRYADLMYELLKAIRADCAQHPLRLPIHDPSLGRDLTTTWTQDNYDEFVAMLDKVIAYLDPVADEADPVKAVDAWQHVFGPDVFRLSNETLERTDEASALAAGAKVTAGGLLVPSASPARGIPSQPHRFYGEE